jgi:hypothetical protein
VRTQQAGKGVESAVVISKVWGLGVALWLLVLPSRVYKRSIDPFTNRNPVYSHSLNRNNSLWFCVVVLSFLSSSFGEWKKLACGISCTLLGAYKSIQGTLSSFRHLNHSGVTSFRFRELPFGKAASVRFLQERDILFMQHSVVMSASEALLWHWHAMELHFKECHQKVILRPSNGFAGSRNLFEKAIIPFAYSFAKKKNWCRLDGAPTAGHESSTSVNWGD